jgi:hypothetical protein
VLQKKLLNKGLSDLAAYKENLTEVNVKLPINPKKGRSKLNNDSRRICKVDQRA